MRAKRRLPSGTRCATGSRQRGVVLLFALIALVIMLIAAVAMIRSFNSSLFNAGNIGFKRDLQNQSDRAVVQVLGVFATTGTLGNSAARANSSPANNYSAQMLPTDTQGIPSALVDGTFTTYGVATNDITSANEPTLAGQAISIRYLVDRLCSTTGNESSLSSGSCMLANNPIPAGTSATNLQGADRNPLCATCASASPQGVVYRLSIMVTGPRNTQSFFQSTFTAPSS